MDNADLSKQTRLAVAHFWATRARQSESQGIEGVKDSGFRIAVTGGKQMDGFVTMLCTLVKQAGIPDAEVFTTKAIELPGYFRATKKWDLLVVVDGALLAAVELKSQVGPSFANNFNNRAEEAIGSAVDLWTAYREGIFKTSPRPWLGYLFLLEDCEKSRTPVSVEEPHFAAFPEFHGASYMKRYEILCRRLVLERHYEAGAFLTSRSNSGATGEYDEPAKDLGMLDFAASLTGKLSGFAMTRKKTS